MSQRKGKRKRRGPAAVHKSRRPVVKDAAGRVHLALVRDPETQRTTVALQAPLFKEAWQNQVAESAAGTTYAMLQGALDAERVVALARHAMDVTSKLADGLIARAPNGTVACKPGCDHCCYQSVGVTTAEALAIAEHLRETRDPEELQVLSGRLQRARELTQDLTAAERFSPNFPCPFLEASRCSIYEVRPLSCRGMNSLDAAKCERHLRDPEARASYLETGVGIESFLEPVRAFHAVSAGLQLGLSELFKLDMRPLDLTAALHELLGDSGVNQTDTDGSESIAGRWLRGLSPLEGARGGDSSNQRNVDELSGRLRG